MFLRLIAFCLLVSLLLSAAPLATEQTHEQNPNADASILLHEAESLYRRGRSREATALYNAIIQSGSDVAAAYVGLTRVYLKQGNVEAARSSAIKAATLNSSLADAHDALGEVFYREGKLHDSRKEFEAALKLSAEDPRAFFGLSRIYRAGFDESNWKFAIDRAHDLDPRDPEIATDWAEALPVQERAQFLEVLISQGAKDGRIGEPQSKQKLEVLKDQELHPERTCRLVTDRTTEEVNLAKSLYSNMRTNDLFVAPRAGLGMDTRKLQFYPGAFVRARLNGIESQLILATGEDGILLNEVFARKIGVKEIARADIEGLGSQNPPEGYIGFVDSVQLGHIEFRDCYVTVAQHAALNNSLNGFDGSLSVRMFSGFLVDIDLAHLKLRLSGLPSDHLLSSGTSTPPTAVSKGNVQHQSSSGGMEHGTPMYQFGRILVIPTMLNGSGPLLFTISTEATQSLVSASAAHESMVAMSGKTQTIRGINGQTVQLEETHPVQLSFAGLTSRVPSLLATDLSGQSQSLGTKISGILGFDVLEKMDIKLDFRDGLTEIDNGKHHE